MRIDHLLAGVESLDMANLYPDMEVRAITCDSRKVTPGSAFVAIPGSKTDGHEFIPEALAAGATMVIQSKPIEPGAVGSFLRVDNPRGVYASLAARIQDYPSRQLRVIGVTGTNGKTSTVLVAQHLLASAGIQAAAIGTLGLRMPGSDQFFKRGLTTPDAADLQAILRDFVDEGITHVVMEVSSHALDQDRVAGVDFAGAVFTNLSQDHFDYHVSKEHYQQAKFRLFTHHLALSGGYAVINGDDVAGNELARLIGGIAVIYGSTQTHNLVISNVDMDVSGLAWHLVVKNGVWPPALDSDLNSVELVCPLVGHYHVYNCVAAIGVGLLEGLSLEQVRQGLASFKYIPGRLQLVPNPRGIHVFVDYAHTPDAVRNVLTTLSGIKQDSARLITVIGCGGDRDPQKRPQMAAIAQELSDMLVITSDNPRREDPEIILDQMMAGITDNGITVVRNTERRQAIRKALDSAESGDIVLVAGKGHEDYQILKDQTIHFSDVEEVQAYFGRSL